MSRGKNTKVTGAYSLEVLTVFLAVGIRQIQNRTKLGFYCSVVTWNKDSGISHLCNTHNNQRLNQYSHTKGDNKHAEGRSQVMWSERGRLLQPGHVWRKQRNIPKVDLHAHHVGLNAVTILWINPQGCTHDRINTHTHVHVCYVEIKEASSLDTYSIRPASPGPRDRPSEVTGRINQPSRRYRLQSQRSRKNLQKDHSGASGLAAWVRNVSGPKGILGAECGKWKNTKYACPCWWLSDSWSYTSLKKWQWCVCVCVCGCVHDERRHSSWPERRGITQTSVTRGAGGMLSPCPLRGPMMSLFQAYLTIGS